MQTKTIYTRDRQQARKKAEQLVQKMTLSEKVSQMLHEAPAIERLGIPAYNWWGEALHGVARAGTATVFPQAIGLAASFDPDLISEIGAAVSTEGRAKYNAQFKYGDHDIYKGLTFWSPNVNIFRDPRWGRGHETFGEDPMLSSKLGVAYIHGLQGDDPEYLKAAACAKHFAVHSGPEDLRHSFDAKASRKEMNETYLPAFKACVQEGEAEAVMSAYNRVNGEAASASHTLLQEILREEWGFQGHVVSDCWAVRDIYTHHGLCDTAEEAAALSIKAGTDLNCGVTYKYAEKAVEDGLLDEADIDKAVIRLFTTRYLLGILGEDQPFKDIDYLENDTPKVRELNRRAARQTTVLLKNDGLLPLAADKLKTLGVIGPNANNRKALVGNYEGTASRYVTVLEGIQDALKDSDTRVLYSEGCHLWQDRISGLGKGNDRISEVKAVCEVSDVIVAVVGLDATLEGEEGDTGNQYGSGDKRDLELPGLQRQVMEAIYSFNKPVILVVLSGSALALDKDRQASAILQGWYPGAEGGAGIADIIFGEVSPQGKLPLSFYTSDYDMGDFEDYSMEGRTYRFTDQDIEYPFGYGLTYSTFELADVRLSADTLGSEGLTVKAKATNTGGHEAAETVQVYVQAPEWGTPLPQLKGMAKLAAKPGEFGEVTISIPESAFAVYNEQGEAVLPEGEYEVLVGFNQGDPRSIALTGHTPQRFTLTR